MKIQKEKFFKNCLILVLLFISIFFYSKYKIEKNKNNFVQLILSRLSISSGNYYEPLQEYTHEHNNINWKEIMREIDSKGTSNGSFGQYITMEYSNGNTLMMEIAQDNKGYYKIHNMFFLNDDTIKKLKFYSK